MKIIFYSYSGVHSAVVAGAAYLGSLSAQQAASAPFSEVPFFGCKEKESKLRYLGEDKRGNRIYALGVGREMELVPKAIKNFLDLFQISQDDLVLINTDGYLSPLSKWGERLAGNGLVDLGNFLVHQGLKKDFFRVLKQVHLRLENGQS